MSRFEYLMKQPLPSKRGDVTDVYQESVMDEDFIVEGCGDECGLDGCEDTESDDIMTPPLAGLNQTPENPEGTEEVPDDLTPEQDQHIDDTMNAVATPMLLAGELNDDDIKEFVESADADVAMYEGFITERTIVRFDKHARKAQLFEVAVAACAREANDPLMRKLDTVYKLERRIKAKLRVKYRAQANRKVKEYLKRAQKSKSGVLARIAAKLTGKKKK